MAGGKDCLRTSLRPSMVSSTETETVVASPVNVRTSISISLAAIGHSFKSQPNMSKFSLLRVSSGSRFGGGFILLFCLFLSSSHVRFWYLTCAVCHSILAFTL